MPSELTIPVDNGALLSVRRRKTSGEYAPGDVGLKARQDDETKDQHRDVADTE